MLQPSQKCSTNSGMTATNIAAIEAGAAKINRVLKDGPAKPQALTNARLAIQTKSSEVSLDTVPPESIAIA